MWHLGESRYIYTSVSEADSIAFTISSASYEVYDSSGVVVASGSATISDELVAFLFTPSAAGTYVSVISYAIGSETFSNQQIIMVTETLS